MTASAELPNPTPGHPRLMQLDVLHGVAILIVLFRHTLLYYYDAGPLHGIMHFVERIGWIGVFSYSIYLWQFDISFDPVKWWSLPHLPHEPRTLYWLLGTGLFTVVAILGGALLARIVEFPVLKLRDRLFPARADAIPVTPATESRPPVLIPVTPLAP